MNKALLKKHKWMIAIGSVLLVMFLLAGWKLFAAAGKFNAEKAQLRAVTARLNQLNNRDPFPSRENVAKQRENLNELLDYYNELNDRLLEGQVEPVDMEASDFMPLLENTLRRLRSGFRASRIKLPTRFTFGFEKYAGGQLPMPDDIPRMVQQLKIIENLSRIIMESQVDEVMDVTRETFEADAEQTPTTGRRGRSATATQTADQTAGVSDILGEGDLFASQSFTITLRGSESAIIDCVNRLIADSMFMVITSLKLYNSRQTVRDEGEARATQSVKEEESPPADPKERPVVIGREELEAVIELDVYQFAPSLSWD